VINLGVCGALDKNIQIGQITAMESVAAVYHARRRPIQLHLLDSGSEDSSVRGRLVTHSFPVFDSRIADQLARRFGASYVDMEAWEVANFFTSMQIPVSVIKCVSDQADQETVAGYSARARRCAGQCSRRVHRLISDI
jgi:nucleoside phosphorylase